MKTINQQLLRKRWMALAVLAASACWAGAQSSDAIIDKLVEKGILTVKEANDLRDETERNFNQAYSVKSGMSDWVNAFKINGDIRGRYEGFYSEGIGTNGVAHVDRSRFRYRVRLGMTAVMMDNFEAGLRLTSSEVAGGGANNEGDPISGNTTMQNNGSKKLVYIDTAYGRWYALNGPDWTGVLTIGKMDNPFVFDDMVFDPDYTPEGAAINVGYMINDVHSLKFNVGGFVLDEFSANSRDPFLLAAQARWDAKWDTKWASTMGAGILSIASVKTLTNSVVPNISRGNTRDADGTLTYGFDPVVVDGAVTYTLPQFPFCYTGPFPIRLAGALMSNPSAPYSSDNYAWNAGIMLGKSGKKGTWDLSYTYKWLGANSWYEELVDSDFGAFYSAPQANSAGSIGYNSGTNVKGHILRFAYSPSDSVTLSVKWFITSLIDKTPPGFNSDMNRLQVDAMWKF